MDGWTECVLWLMVQQSTLGVITIMAMAMACLAQMKQPISIKIDLLSNGIVCSEGKSIKVQPVLHCFSKVGEGLGQWPISRMGS